MKKQIINKIAEELHGMIRDTDNCVWRLPNSYSMTYEFNGHCELELRKDSDGGHCTVMNSINFKPLSNGDWVSVEVIDRYVGILLANAEFEDSVVQNWLKEA